MTATRYTPGPWFARGEWVYAHHHRGGAMFVAMATYGGPTAAANAQLISAAPELLDALQQLADAVEKFTNATPEDWPELAQARAAIAKGLGEAAT